MNLHDLADHARVIHVLAEKLLEQTGEIGEELDQKEALDFHCATLEVKRLLSDVHRIAEDILVKAVGEKSGKTTIDGTTIDVRRSYRRTWDSPLLAGAVAACTLQGERLDEVDQVIQALLKVARFEWRVTALTDLGISPDRYCDKDLGRATVTLL